MPYLAYLLALISWLNGSDVRLESIQLLAPVQTHPSAESVVQRTQISNGF